MLKPREIEDLPLAMIELYSVVEQEILDDMARRISGFDCWITSADWQYQKLVEAGNFHSFILEALSSRTGKSRRELEQLMQEAGAKSLAFDTGIYHEVGLTVPPLAESKALCDVLAAGLAATNQTMKNLTRSTAKTATKQFEDALDAAWLQIHSGAFSPDVAVRSAIKKLAKAGVQSIAYPSGHTDSLEVAVRRAAMTGVNQTSLQLQLTLAEEVGSDLVETTAHAGARPSHALWQGQIFSLSGKSRQYPEFRSSTGYGDGAGLGGWNCSHSFRPYFEGMPRTYSKTLLEDYEAKNYSYKGQKLTEYEAMQEQRGIERNIRRWKRECSAMGAAGLDSTQAAGKLSEWQRKQREFLEETGIKRQAGREYVAGWGRSDAVRASAATRKSVDKYAKLRYNKDGTIVVTDDWTQKGHTSIPPQYKPNAVVDTLSRAGKQHDRTIYDAGGNLRLQIHGGDHGQPKKHSYGEHGEHCHEYTWEEGNKKPDRTSRNATETERRQHFDILGGEKP